MYYTIWTFENEIGPGVLQSCPQQTGELQDYQRHKSHATVYVSILSMLVNFFAAFMFISGKKWQICHFSFIYLQTRKPR